MKSKLGARNAATRLRLVALAGVAALAQFAALPAAALTPGQEKLNGFWNIDTESRAAALSHNDAELTAAGKAIAAENQKVAEARRAQGQFLGLNSYICGALGIPFIINTSEPWLLVVTDKEAIQVAERRQVPPRRYYLDGRQWPDLSKLPPSPSGYSIAHWEGDELVIETRGLPDGATYNGGLKGEHTVLTERVRLGPDDDHLTWSYSWADPVLMAKPVTYSVGYTREKETIYAYTHDCDPNFDAAALPGAPDSE